MKNSSRRLFYTILMAFVLTCFLPSVPTEAKTILDKKTKVRYELIESKERLMEVFKDHVFNLDSSFKIYVSSNAVKDFPKEFKGIWKELLKDPKFSETWRFNTEYKSQFKNYSQTSAQCWEWNVIKAKYAISKKDLKDVLASIGGNPISTMKDLVDKYSKSVLEAKEVFVLNVGKNVIKDFDTEYKGFEKKLKKVSGYSNIMEYARVLKSTPYDNKDFWRWEVRMDYQVSNDTVKDVIAGQIKKLNSKKELKEEFIKRLKRLDRKVVLKLSKNVIDFDDTEAYEALWRDLYSNKEFSKIFSRVKKFNHKLVNRGKNMEWVINLQYKASKK